LLNLLRRKAETVAVTLTTHRNRAQPSGQDTLEVRRRYLRRQRSRARDAGHVAMLIALGGIGCFLATVGLTVFVVGSR
jgi:hypothetical protein